MSYAIELFFDKEMEQKLFDYPKKIAEKKLSTKYLEWRTRPHITLAGFHDVDVSACIEKLKSFADCHSMLPAHIGSVGMFTDTKTIFASPIMTGAMYQLQRELHTCMQGFDTNGWEWYLPDRWVPHCGLALMGEDHDEAYYRACDLILREFKKISGKFSSIGLVKISFPVEEIYIAELGGN